AGVEGWLALGGSGDQPRPGPPHAASAETSQPASPDGEGSTLILEVAPGVGTADASAGNGKKLIGFTVDEVMDMVAVADTTLEDRHGLPGVDPTLVRAVGRRNRGKDLFIVLDVAALLGPILTT